MFTLMWPHLLKSLSLPWSLYANPGPCPGPWEWSPCPGPGPGPWWKVLVNITATRSLLRWEGFVEKVDFEPAVIRKREEVMDAESGDDDKGGLTRAWRGESREDWRDWRNESGSRLHEMRINEHSRRQIRSTRGLSATAELLVPCCCNANIATS